MLITAPLGSELHQEPFHYYGGYTPHWYCRFLPEAGVDVESIVPNRGFFSFFAQEGQRFSVYLSPLNRSRPRRWSPALLLLWLITWPLFRLMLPLLAGPLDRLGLERAATVGYHVAGRKRSL